MRNIKDDLYYYYKEWRKISEEMLKDGMEGNIDCAENIVREDFSKFAKLEGEISYEDMATLQYRYYIDMAVLQYKLSKDN